MKASKLLRTITERIGLQMESLPGISLLELSSDDRILIEYPRRVVSCSDGEIVIQTNFGIVEIFGDCLSLQGACKDRIVICGDIKSINLKRGG